MSDTIAHQLATRVARAPDTVLLGGKFGSLSGAAFNAQVQACAAGLLRSGARPGDHVAIWLPKQVETVVAIYAAAVAGLVFVPINPALKPGQVRHILSDSQARLLVTAQARLDTLDRQGLPPVVILVDGDGQEFPRFDSMLAGDAPGALPAPDQLAALLYTSGSTGLAKGVMLSHRNIALSARSVQQYLALTPADRVLSVLPLSFDYGLNQLTSTIAAGGSVFLLDHLFPQDVVQALVRHQISGLAAVPPLWTQLAALDLEPVARDLRYITNSGGRLPEPVVRKLAAQLPQTRIFLMYGLTEAFRSTFLPPDQVLSKPASVGKPIPFANIEVVRPDGSRTDPGEVGELVHAGPLVAQGYWRDAERTAVRFRTAPACFAPDLIGTPAVWSGDQCVRDADGDLYFIGRDDEMIKTSGYRVSPTEVEEAVYATGLADEAVAFSLPSAELGQVVGLVARPLGDATAASILKALKQSVAGYMVPQYIALTDGLPRSANGKIDRAGVVADARSTWEAQK